jgi:hypothetical protein
VDKQQAWMMAIVSHAHFGGHTDPSSIGMALAPGHKSRPGRMAQRDRGWHAAAGLVLRARAQAAMIHLVLIIFLPPSHDDMRAHVRAHAARLL